MNNIIFTTNILHKKLITKMSVALLSTRMAITKQNFLAKKNIFQKPPKIGGKIAGTNFNLTKFKFLFLRHSFNIR